VNAPSHSSYHSLQARLQQRFANGFTLLGSYAYAKSIDNGSGIRTTDGDALTPSNNYTHISVFRRAYDSLGCSSAPIARRVEALAVASG
jgi:hypothetical protein